MTKRKKEQQELRSTEQGKQAAPSSKERTIKAYDANYRGYVSLSEGYTAVREKVATRR